MSKKIFNLDVEILGSLNLSNVPNTIGDILTFTGLNQVASRTPAQILSDIGAASANHTHLIGDITDFVDNSSDWDAAFGWGNHADENYTSLSSGFDDGHIVFFDATGKLTYEPGLEWNGSDLVVPGELIAFNVVVNEEAYNEGDWNGSQEVPTKNAIRDWIEDFSVANINATGTADATTYLRGDGVWATVAGGGVTSVFGRTGVITALESDYSSFYAPLVHTHTTSDITDLSSYTGFDSRYLGITDKAADSELFDGLDSSQFLRSDIEEVKIGGDLRFNDNIKAAFGTSKDMKIFHSGVDNIIQLDNEDLIIRDGATERIRFSRTTGNITATNSTGTSIITAYRASDSLGELQGNVSGGALRLLSPAQGTTIIRSYGDSEFLGGGISLVGDITMPTTKIRDNGSGALVISAGGSDVNLRPVGDLNATGQVQIFPSYVNIGSDNIRMQNISSRVKYSVWTSNSYGMGFGDAYTYGGLNGFAMTFQMNTSANRGWWWGTDAHTNAQGAMSLTNAGVLTVDSYVYSKAGYGRREHHKGCLLGGQSNIGGANTFTNPIHCIGSAHTPSSTTLNNMYGIGYSDANQASFLNSSDLGTNPDGWGMYVASAGTARIFLDGNNGRGHFKSNVYASNFILNSDRRKKENIQDASTDYLSVRWRKFDLKEECGGDKDRHGVIAQELQENHPEFVESDSEGNLTVKYIDLLCAKIAELEARIKQLE